MDRPLLKVLATSVAFVRQGAPFSSALTLGANNRWGTQPSQQYAKVNQPSAALRQFTTLHSTSSSNLSPVWYCDPFLSRGDIPFTPSNHINLSSPENARFVLLQEGERGLRHLISISGELKEGNVDPLFLTFDQVHSIMGDELIGKLLEKGEYHGQNMHSSLIWLGNHDDEDGDAQRQYCAIYNSSNDPEALLNNEHLINAANTGTSSDENQKDIKFLPLREFGDRIHSSQDAAIHSIANGLIEFHKSHKFCSTCGSSTIIQKSGASRICSNNKRSGGSCSAPSIYPRIDVASIMLITSPCENYALLGRKASWPSGRYSTLAGFLEIGETIEDCCARETLEESGVSVDKDTISFVRSQPWPFPRSLMAGFRAKALTDQEGEDSLPKIDFDTNEMEDVKWFRKDFVAERLDGGSTALLYDPTDEEKEFHIPGKASLARYLISSWALEN